MHLPLITANSIFKFADFGFINDVGLNSAAWDDRTRVGLWLPRQRLYLKREK